MGEHTKYSAKRVGKGVRRFNGELFTFLYTASMKGSFANKGYQKHKEEVNQKAKQLKKQGYKIRVVPNSKGEFIFYSQGERKR